MTHQDIEGPAVELNPVGAMRLRPSELGAVGTHDEGPCESEGLALEVDVAPPKGEQLAATGPGGHREPEIAMERRVGVPHSIEERPQGLS